MKPAFSLKRIAIPVIAAGVAMLLGGILYLRTQASHPSSHDYNRVLAVARAYASELVAQGKPIPETVTLQELTALGRIGVREALAFKDLEVILRLKQGEAGPQEALMVVKFPDGPDVIALGDGSVQQRRSTSN